MATFVVGQYKNTATTLGIGNPHRQGRCLGASESAMLLPTTASPSSSHVPIMHMWFAVHPGERLLTCGFGTKPNRQTTYVIFPLTAAEAQGLEFTTVAVSNWNGPVQIGLVRLGPAPRGFLPSAAKFKQHRRSSSGLSRQYNCLPHPPKLTSIPRLSRSTANLAQQLKTGALFAIGFFAHDMTACELTSSNWSKSRFVDNNASWEQCHEGIKERVEPPFEQPKSNDMCLPSSGGCLNSRLTSVCLEAGDSATQQALIDFRQKTCQLAGFDYNPPYRFHITLAYLLYHPVVGGELTDEFRKVHAQMSDCIRRAFEQPSSCLRLVPELTHFQDMNRFTPY